MLENLLLLLAGLVGLFFGGNWLVRGASNLAMSFGVSILIIALTFVAIGTSMPELLVSVQAALAGKSDLAIGNVLGSNIANIGLILGATGLIAPLSVKAVLLRREIPIMILFTIFTYILTLDGQIGRVDGLLLLFSFAGFNTMFYFLAKKEQDARDHLLADFDDEQIRPKLGRPKEFLFLMLGIVALVIGSRLMVEGAVNIARLVGVSELVIAITLVAFGTSLPELAASLSAAFHKETDLAIGNIVGSNIANLLLILGLTSLLRPIAVSRAEVQFEFLVMIAFAVLLIPFTRHQKFGRRQSAVFLGAYIAFIIYSLTADSLQILIQ
ncbi:MAG: calcium/sodium antiporter [Chloroflexota bacterium]|nr:calcium/sodium antiporter [Chloroflexota bacterium]MDE2951838.1 calcium/sodium antiporter [Chloroflexota bacterium]